MDLSQCSTLVGSLRPAYLLSQLKYIVAMTRGTKGNPIVLQCPEKVVPSWIPYHRVKGGGWGVVPPVLNHLLAMRQMATGVTAHGVGG